MGAVLAGLNLGLLAAFLVLFVFFKEVQNLVFNEGAYPYLTAMVVAVFIIVSLKLWLDYSLLLREWFSDLNFKGKFRKILLVDLIGILPFLTLVLLKNMIDGLKYLANPSSVTNWDVANSLILMAALIVQIILVEAVALNQSKQKDKPEAKINSSN